jgi:hypothetical protein
MMLTLDEIDTIKGCSEWNENNQDFTIPPFTFKNKKVKFPSLSNA